MSKKWDIFDYVVQGVKCLGCVVCSPFILIAGMFYCVGWIYVKLFPNTEPPKYEVCD